MKCDSPIKGQQHKSILKTDSPGQSGEGKRVHFLVNEETKSALANASLAADDQVDSEERNMEQLMAAAETAETATATGTSTSTPDKDSSTITIFNENSEVGAHRKSIGSLFKLASFSRVE